MANLNCVFLVEGEELSNSALQQLFSAACEAVEKIHQQFAQGDESCVELVVRRREGEDSGYYEQFMLK